VTSTFVMAVMTMISMVSFVMPAIVSPEDSSMIVMRYACAHEAVHAHNASIVERSSIVMHSVMMMSMSNSNAAAIGDSVNASAHDSAITNNTDLINLQSLILLQLLNNNSIQIGRKICKK